MNGYVSTGQDVLENTMFAYGGNNLVNRIDSTGQFWSEIWGFAKTTVVLSGAVLFIVGAPMEAQINAGSGSIQTQAVKSVVIKWNGGY